MATRLWLFAVSGFWVLMSVLLWRAEFGSQRHRGSEVPVSMVWGKMLTAPDPSGLEIRHGTNRIGYCRWRPEIGEQLTARPYREEDNPLEGMVRQLAYYRVDLDGNVSLPEFPGRLRFTVGLRLDTNYAWQTFDSILKLGPDLYELRVNSGEQTAHFRVDAGADKFNRTFSFADLQQPQRLMTQFGGPMFPTLLATMGLPLSTNGLNAGSLGLHWKARNDSLKIGRSHVRAYRLETKLLDRYPVVLHISPVGEVLRARLPNDIILVNDALTGLRAPPPEKE